jgi:hypothetical protein
VAAGVPRDSGVLSRIWSPKARRLTFCESRRAERLRAGGPEKNVVIVISDGGDNASSLRLSEVLRRVARSSAIVYTIGYLSNSAASPGVMRTIRMVARATSKGDLSVRTRNSYIASGAEGAK